MHGESITIFIKFQVNILKKILIIFPNEWLAYTPTLLNIVDALTNLFDITVITIDNGLYNNEKIKHRQEFNFIEIDDFLMSSIAFLSKIIKKSNKADRLIKLFFISIGVWKWKKQLRRDEKYEVMAVDSLGLFIAQKYFDKCHLISLEPHKDFFYRRTDANLIESVIAHSQERYDFLFETIKPKCFVIPNSPRFESHEIPELSELKTPKAIFFGNANPRNGIYFILEALRNIKNISLTIRGTISSADKKRFFDDYSDLFESRSVSIEEDYIPQDKIIDYLSQFYLGFCFYDFKYVDEITKFNFISVPSGKMFNYYAAGVPVIGSDIMGLKSVRDFEAGILIKNITSNTISQAIENIIERHQYYRINCLKAAKHFDFETAVKPLQKYFLSK